MQSDVDNLSENEQKRRKLILQIQELRKMGFSIPEIIQITGKDRKTIKNIWKEIRTNCVTAMHMEHWKNIQVL